MHTFKRMLSVALIPILLSNLFIFQPAFADGEQYLSDNAIRSDSMAGVKQRGNIQVGESTGVAIYEYPISLPAGRSGLTPSLGIRYNSQDESLDNLTGYHWSVNQYSIKRLNKKGVDQLYDRNDFIVETPISSGELLELGNGLYAEEIESSFARYEFSNNSWIVTDKGGKQYIFGNSDYMRKNSPERI